MGIGDDIRPKSFKRLSNDSSKPAKKAEKKKQEITHDLFTRPDDEDFFANTPIEKNGKSHKDYSHDSQPEKSANHHRANFHWVYTLIITLVILTLAGLVAWQNLDLIKSLINGSYKKQNDQNLSDIISSTNDSVKNYDTAGQAPTNQPVQSTTAPTIDKSAIKMEVLNGSGVKNSAQAVSDQLTAAGFTILYTGNANKFTYQTSIVYFKTGKDAEANLVKESLTGRVVETEESNIVVGSKYDVVVVVGKT